MFYALDGHQPKMEDRDSTWVADSADLIGKILLEAESSVWFGVVMRGDNELITLGRRSNAQEQCVFHTDIGIPTTIGDNCTIGHGAIIHGCTIGNNCLIGMGAIIMNNAVIGDNCIIGAGTLVTERKFFPENSLIIGSPARVLRKITNEEIAYNTASAEHYHANALRFKKSLEKVEPFITF